MKGRITLAEAERKIMAFCAARERCHSEVRTKLISLKIYGDDLEVIIGKLVSQGFLNEERFARAYVSGKFRINKWGRTKILYGLKMKKVSDYCINKGMDEIHEDEYRDVLYDLINKQLKGETSFAAKQKVVASMQRKGYETPLILELIND